MLCKEEEDEVSLLFVNDCFYDKRNEVVDFIDKYDIESVDKQRV
jgi:purine-nucleoside phosphorylase